MAVLMTTSMHIEHRNDPSGHEERCKIGQSDQKQRAALKADRRSRSDGTSKEQNSDWPTDVADGTKGKVEIKHPISHLVRLAAIIVQRQALQEEVPPVGWFDIGCCYLVLPRVAPSQGALFNPTFALHLHL
jgi:hypothetical protein